MSQPKKIQESKLAGSPGVSGKSKKVNWRKWKSLSVILVSGALMILSHQNCAPAPMGVAQVDSSVNGDDGSPVSVIDDVKSGATVSFAQKAVEISSTAETAILEGVCPEGQDDAVLGWNLVDAESQQDFASGYAKCSNDKFLVELTPTQELSCDREYKLSAQLGFGQGAEVTVSRRCGQSDVADLDGSAIRAHLEVDARAIMMFGSSTN